MTENKPSDDRDKRTTDQTKAVTLEDIVALEEGDAIAVRTTIGEYVEMFAGRVDANPPSMATIENDFDEYFYLLPVDTNLWWVLEDGQIDDRIHELDELPLYHSLLHVFKISANPPSISPLSLYKSGY